MGDQRDQGDEADEDCGEPSDPEGREREFKVPSSKILRIVVLLETAVRIHHQEGNHEFEL